NAQTEEVKDFGAGWKNGRRFALILHSLDPNLINPRNYPASCSQDTNSVKESLKTLFEIAERELHIPQLVEPQDLDIEKPDERSIMTYLAQFYKKFPNGKPKIESDDRLSSNPNEDEDEGIGDLQVTSKVDPKMVMSEHTPPLHRRQIGMSNTMPVGISNEELQLILEATGDTLDSTLGSTLLTQSLPVGGFNISANTSPSGRVTSPYRTGKAKSYAGIKLGRVAKHVSRARAMARIKITGETEQEKIRHNVTIIKAQSTTVIDLCCLPVSLCPLKCLVWSGKLLTISD
ncbi:hypothetical protein Ciccas_005568, partial [Cichlidogyrus casuarinus]